MKVKRYKHVRKVLSFYKHTFGVHEPFQILGSARSSSVTAYGIDGSQVDGTFCQAALSGKVQLKEQLPKYFGGSIQLVTTRCVVAELGLLGEELRGAMYIAKRFQQRRCSHGKEKLTAAECILSLTGEGNPHHYFVASQDRELRNQLREIPGTPLLHIIRNTIVLENPSDSSHQQAEKLLAAKVNPTEYEQSIIDTLNAEAAPKEAKKHRKKRAKGPNPLSVKKSKTLHVLKPVSAGVLSQSKKRRLRLQRRRALEVLTQTLESTKSKSTSGTEMFT